MNDSLQCTHLHKTLTGEEHHSTRGGSEEVLVAEELYLHFDPQGAPDPM